jgi:hypothetical protein
VPPVNDPFASLPVARKKKPLPKTGDIDLRDAGETDEQSDPFADLAVDAEAQVKGGLEQIKGAFAHPLDAAKAIVKGIATSARDTFKPVVGSGEMPGSTRFGDEAAIERSRSNFRVTKENTPDAITPKEQALAAANTAINLALPAAGALSLPARAALNAGIGAMNDSDQPLRGATAGLVLGETVHAGGKLIGRAGKAKTTPIEKPAVSEAVPTPEASPVEAPVAKPDPVVEAEPPAKSEPQTVAPGVVEPRVETPPAEVPKPVAARGTKVREMFDSARTPNGDLRPFHRVSDDGLIRELSEYQTKIADAEQRSVYNFTTDENFHSTEDGRGVFSATRVGGKGVSQQAKALQNLKDYSRIMDEIDAELFKRGHTKDTVYDRQQHLAELDAALERDAIAHADAIEQSDTAFDFADDKPPAPANPFAELQTKLDEAKDRRAAADVEPALDPDRPPAAVKREYLNYDKFALDQTTESRVRDAVERGRAEGTIDKGKKTFAEQRAEADRFAKELVANPLDIDLSKMRNLSGAQIVGLHSVVGENTRIIEATSRAINSGELSPAELAEASALVDRATKSTDQALGAIVREKASTARDLGFLRQVARQSTDPDVWLVQAKKMLGDRPMPDSIMLEIRKLANEATLVCGGG